MKVVNFFGGPGTGKSTAAAGLFYLMKKHGANCEYVPEFAKELVWEERFNVMTGDQFYIMAQQHRSIDRLRGKVDYVVTDSPLLLSAIYAEHNQGMKDLFGGEEGLRLFQSLVTRLHDKYDNDNYFMLSEKFRYQAAGRIQEETESVMLDEKIFDFLVERRISFRVVEASEEGALEGILERAGLRTGD